MTTTCRYSAAELNRVNVFWTHHYSEAAWFICTVSERISPRLSDFLDFMVIPKLWKVPLEPEL